MFLSQTIRLFLDSLGRSEEYEFYLRKFQSEQSSCLCLIIPDRASIGEGLEALSYQLDFLLRLELYPVILFTGPASSEMFSQFISSGIDSNPFHIDDRMRASGDETIHGRLRLFAEKNRIEKKIGAIVSEAYHLPGALEKIVPVLTRRIHLLRPEGALRSSRGSEVFLYRLNGSEGRARADLREEDRPVVDLAADLFARLPGTHISITSPYLWLKEIFTVKGAGTVVRQGSRILREAELSRIDRNKLLALLAESFRRPLRDASFLDHVGDFYIEEDYRGAVLLEKTPYGDYLSKFAVGTQARGEGIAQELWEEVILRHERLFWRSRSANSVNRWYARLAEGMQRSGPWTIFWRGIKTEDIPGIINYCVNRPEDFSKAGE